MESFNPEDTYWVSLSNQAEVFSKMVDLPFVEVG